MLEIYGKMVLGVGIFYFKFDLINLIEYGEELVGLYFYVNEKILRFICIGDR